MASASSGKTGSNQSPVDKTFYNILNVSPNASSSEIKKAYYALSLQYHPDRTQNLDEATRREYAERFKAISHAYSEIRFAVFIIERKKKNFVLICFSAILSDPEKRSLYNR